MIRPNFLAAMSALFLCLPAAAPARDLGTATGPVVLTVTDAAGGTWSLDRAMIEALGWQTITTVTPFTEGPQEFAGIPLSALAEATGAEGTVIEAVAINDYMAQIPA
ncbi:MAG: oxidoreductase, partial [Rhodobacteraceae bacterium]|nr:oxidoreductase [Paracoccaceae bacterium]